MPKKIYRLLIFATIALVFFYCKPRKNNGIPLDIPKDSFVCVKIFRYDSVLMSLDVNNLKAEVKRYQPDFMLFLDADLNDTLNLVRLYNFVSDPVLHEIYDDVNKTYPNLINLQTQLSNAFTIFKYNFPESPIPKIYTYLSFLDYENKVIYLDTVMAIAIDMYLGSDYKMYSSARIPKYLTLRLDSNFIVTDAMKAIAERSINFEISGKTLLDIMIYRGKLLFFLDEMLPNVADNVKIGYTMQQLEWCEKNEEKIWAFLIENNLLFNNDFYKIRPLITEAPSTKGFVNSAPRMVDWVGWQIIKQYNSNNKKISLSQLLDEKDSQKILKLSKYKPKK